MAEKGDLNTAYFHKVANGRRRYNTISSLLINDMHIDSPSTICTSIEQYFFSLFNKNRYNMVDFNWDLLLPRKISDPSILEGYFSEEEIKRSVSSLPGKKSPGPDRFPLCFYQHFWDDIKRDIFEMFDHFYNSDDINTLRSVNQTFIALIPKKTTTEKIQDYRPISLLNSSYRLFPSA